MLNNKTFICKIIKDNIWIMIDHHPIQAYIKGNLRLNHKISIGDYVEYTIENNQYLITNILESKNHLYRPNVSNIDLLVIIQSAIEPEFNEFFIEKTILFYLNRNINHIYLAISKIDLLNKNQKEKINEIINKYNAININCFDLNNQVDFDNLLLKFKDKIVCLVGNSGVGKSTFINKIKPDLNLTTQEISKCLNRGKHTTTNSTIIYIKNFYLVDTPGFSTICIDNIDQTLLNNYYFYHFRNYLNCKYLNCTHTHENNCSIKNELKNNKLLQWRYNQYLYILKNNNKKY